MIVGFGVIKMIIFSLEKLNKMEINGKRGKEEMIKMYKK